MLATKKSGQNCPIIPTVNPIFFQKKMGGFPYFSPLFVVTPDVVAIICPTYVLFILYGRILMDFLFTSQVVHDFCFDFLWPWTACYGLRPGDSLIVDWKEHNQIDSTIPCATKTKYKMICFAAQLDDGCSVKRIKYYLRF